MQRDTISAISVFRYTVVDSTRDTNVYFTKDSMQKQFSEQEHIL